MVEESGARHALFVPCPRGLEEALADELRELGLAAVEAVGGGVHAKGGWEAVYRANLHSRLASRILWRVGAASYGDADDIYRLARGVAWEIWFTASQSIRVDVSATKSPLQSLEFATLRIKDGVCDRFRDRVQRRPDVDTQHPDVRIFAYLDAREATLYLDTSGEALFKRGWRTETGAAPLRENLAAGILRLAGWQPGVPLFDPMCGSGTFVVEAAQMALGIAPGQTRSFGFEKLLNFEPETLARLRAARRAPATAGALHLIRASDIAGDAVATTRANLVRAGVDEASAAAIAAKQIDARHIRNYAETGILVMNPPYGERVSVRGAGTEALFFGEFGDTLKQRFAGWTCHVLTSDMAFQKKLRLAPARRVPLFNGAIECRLFRFDIVSGSARQRRAPAALPDAPP